MAPTKYEEVELLEVGEEVRRPMTKRRIVGVVVAMVAIVGLVGVSTLPKTPASQMGRLSVARRALMKAFSTRSLTELTQTKATASFALMQEGVDSLDGGLSIKATAAADPEPAEKPQIEVHFRAQDGKGEDLKAALTKLAKAILEEENGGHDHGHDHGEEPESRRLDDPPPDELEGSPVQINNDGDKVLVVVIPPVDDNQEFEDDMAEGMENVKFEASLKLGRTLDEMYDDNTENLPMTMHGMQIKFEAAFAVAVCGAIQVAGEEMAEPVVSQDQCDAMTALSSVNLDTEIRYRDPAELSDEIKNKFPPFSAILHMMAGGLAGAPDEIKAAMKNLDGLTEGIERIALRGLPNDFQIAFECENFKVATILKKLLDLVDGIH